MSKLIIEEANDKIFSYFYISDAQCTSKQIFKCINHYRFSALLLKLLHQVAQS